MKKIKVLIVAGTMDSGGQENQLMHIARNADKSIFQIDYTSTLENAFYKDEIESLGGKYHHIPSFTIRNPLKYCKAVYSILKKGGYDVVHSNELFHSGIVVLIAKLAGVKNIISHSHSGSDSYGNNASLLRSLYHYVMRLLINSFSTNTIACSTIAGEFLFGKKTTQKSNYHLVFNSVDTYAFLSLYNRDIENDELHTDGKKAVFHAGHVLPLKNQELLINVAEQLKCRNSNVHIYSAGAGKQEYIDELNEKIVSAGLEGYITLMGLRKDVPKLMKMADAFVLPSKFEGMPLSVIEAQASGLPCVCADTFSHEVDFGIDLIKWLSLDEDVDAWADALEEIVIKPKADKELVEAAINKNGFDSRIYANKLCDIYLLKNH